MYEFWVDEDLNVVNIRVSRGNCLAVPVELDVSNLPEGIEDKLYDKLKKLYEKRTRNK